VNIPSDDEVPNIRTSAAADALSSAKVEFGFSDNGLNVKRIINGLGAAELPERFTGPE
jgi:hypothetical protein